MTGLEDFMLGLSTPYMVLRSAAAGYNFTAGTLREEPADRLFATVVVTHDGLLSPLTLCQMKRTICIAITFSLDILREREGPVWTISINLDATFNWKTPYMHFAIISIF